MCQGGARTQIRFLMDRAGPAVSAYGMTFYFTYITQHYAEALDVVKPNSHFINKLAGRTYRALVSTGIPNADTIHHQIQYYVFVVPGSYQVVSFMAFDNAGAEYRVEE